MLTLIFTVTACQENSKNTSTSNSFQNYDWEHNLKTPEDKEKLLSQVIENGEVIEDYKYDDEGKLTYMMKKDDYGVTTTSKFFYDQNDNLKKKVSSEEGNNEENKIVATYEYDNQGNVKKRLIKKEDKTGIAHKKVDIFNYDDQGRLIKREKYNLPDDLSKEKKIIEWEERKYDSEDRIIYRKLVNKNDYIDMEWRYKYNQYDKLIYKQILSHGKEKLLKKYTNEKDPKILVEKDIRNGSVYKYNEYQYNDEGKVVKEVDKANPDKVYVDIYSYNEKGLLKSDKQKLKGKVKHIINYYYDEDGNLIKKESNNYYHNTKMITKNKDNKTITKGYKNKKLYYIEKGFFDEKDRPIRWYRNNMEHNHMSIKEYKYNIKDDIEWKCKLNDEIICWYYIDIDKKNQKIKITKKNKTGEEMYSAYFKYMYSDSKVNFKLIKVLTNKNKLGERLEINETYWENSKRADFKKNNLSLYFGETKLINRSEDYYDKAGKKLFKNVNNKHEEKKVEYNYIYK